MKRASGELFQAVDGLRRAVEAEFAGNSYYLLSQQITELCELLGFDDSVAASDNGGSTPFVWLLDDVRKRVEAELFDNQFYLVAHKLDAMAFLGGPLSIEPQKVNGNAPTFDDLAAASMARVEQVAATLGVPMSPRRGQSAALQPETLADGELERRSSEPCFLGEFFPPSMDQVASSSIPAEAVPTADIVNSTPDLGLSSLQVHNGGTASERDGRPPEEEEKDSRKVQPATATHDSATASTGQTMTKTDEPKPAEEKALFTLWLDLIFGRKT